MICTVSFSESPSKSCEVRNKRPFDVREMDSGAIWDIRDASCGSEDKSSRRTTYVACDLRSNCISVMSRACLVFAVLKADRSAREAREVWYLYGCGTANLIEMSVVDECEVGDQEFGAGPRNRFYCTQ